MARLLLKQDHRGHLAGEIIEIDPRRAAQLVLERVGVLAPPKAPSTDLQKLEEMLLQFRVKLDSLNFSENDTPAAKELLQKAIIPILPAFIDPPNSEQLKELGLSAADGVPATPVDVLTWLATEVDRLLKDVTTDPFTLEALQTAIDAFAAKYSTKLVGVGDPGADENREFSTTEVTRSDAVAASIEVSDDGKDNESTPAPVASEPTPEVSSKPRSRWNHDDWVNHAKSVGIEIPDGASKADIAKLVEAESTPAPVG